MGAEEPRPVLIGAKLGKVRNLVVGIEFVLQKRHKVMGIGGEQGVLVRVNGEMIAIHDRESQGFEPSGARFWNSGQYNVIVIGLEVVLEGDNGLNLRRLAPKALVLVEVGSSPAPLFGKRGKQLLALVGELLFLGPSDTHDRTTETQVFYANGDMSFWVVDEINNLA